MTGHQSGFTLVELMAVCVLTAILAGAMIGIGAQAHETERRSSAYSRDLLECRVALRLLENDVRAARSVEVEESGIVCHHSESLATWTLEGRELVREDASARRVVARAVGGLDVELDGDLVRAAVRLERRRSSDGPRRGATITSVIHMRAPEAR